MSELTMCLVVLAGLVIVCLVAIKICFTIERRRQRKGWQFIAKMHMHAGESVPDEVYDALSHYSKERK